MYTLMETLASFTGHHPDICNLQYETYCLTLPLKMQSFSTAKHQQTMEIPMVITSNIAAVSDGKWL